MKVLDCIGKCRKKREYFSKTVGQCGARDIFSKTATPFVMRSSEKVRQSMS